MTQSATAAASSSSSTARSSACSASSGEPRWRPPRADRQEERQPRADDRAAPHRRRPGRRPRRGRSPKGRPLRPTGRPRQGAARLAREREGREPHRHPRPRHPARVHPARCCTRPSAPARRHSRAARIGATCPSSPSIRSTPRITTTPFLRASTPIVTNPGGFIIDVAIADVAHYVRPGLRARPRGPGARQFDLLPRPRRARMLPERISNDLCSLRPGEDRAALAVRMVIGADGRKREHTFHRVLMRSFARLHYAQAQAAIDGRPGRRNRAAARPWCCGRSVCRPTRRLSVPATSATRSISTCPSAKSC